VTDPHEAALTAHQAAEDRDDAAFAEALARVRERWDANPEDEAGRAIVQVAVPSHTVAAILAVAHTRGSRWQEVSADIARALVHNLQGKQALQEMDQ
jgi:hypothetical protein